MHLGTRALSGVLALPGPAHVDSCVLATSSTGISRIKLKVLRHTLSICFKRKAVLRQLMKGFTDVPIFETSSGYPPHALHGLEASVNLNAEAVVKSPPSRPG